MTEPVANADDRQPGGSGAGSTMPNKTLQQCIDELRRSEHSAGMVANWLEPYRAALEAAQREIERLKAAVASYETGITWQTTCLEHAHNLDWAYARHLELENERDQSRATEAELRAKIEEVRREGLKRAIDALDAAEQPACAETAPRVDSEHAIISDDRSDLETAEGSL